MNVYLLPISDGQVCWIEKVTARGIVDAESKLVKYLAEDYEFIDYGDSFDDMKAILIEHGFTVGDLYDIEEF